MQWQRQQRWTSGTQPGGRTYFRYALVNCSTETSSSVTAQVQPQDAEMNAEAEAGKAPVAVEIPLSRLHLMFDVRHTVGKGRSLFAKVAIKENTRFQYTGKRMEEKELAQLQAMAQKDKNNTHGFMDYVCDSGDDKVVVDGHPRHNYNPTSAMVNEPSIGQTDNLAFSYAGNEGKRYPVLVAIAPIAAGSELLVCYGASFKRNYEVAKGAQLPHWWPF